MRNALDRFCPERQDALTRERMIGIANDKGFPLMMGSMLLSRSAVRFHASIWFRSRQQCVRASDLFSPCFSRIGSNVMIETR